MPSKKPSKELSKKWLNDPSNWHFGIFYYNKEDKRLLPPKRIPFLGWTVNFANIWSILFMIGIIGAVLLLALLIG